MRKAMFLLISSALIFSLVGCGTDTSATSSSSSVTTDEVVTEGATDKTEVAELETTKENEKLNNSSNDETKTEEPKRDKSSVKWEDYFDGNTWDLTAYAKALGYEWLPDPEYEGTLAMYKIVHSDGNYFCCYHQGVVFIFLGDNNGGCWHCNIGTLTGATKNFVIVSAGQEDVYVDETSYIESVAKLFEFVARDDVDLTKIPGEAYGVLHHEGVAQYFDNGLIKQREFGKVIDYQTCRNIDD